MKIPINDIKIWHAGKKSDWAQIQNTGKEKTLNSKNPKELKSVYDKTLCITQE